MLNSLTATKNSSLRKNCKKDLTAVDVCAIISYVVADMLELADETDSKSVASNGVWVQVPLSAPNLIACTLWYGRFLFSMGDAP